MPAFDANVASAMILLPTPHGKMLSIEERRPWNSRWLQRKWPSRWG